MSVYEKLGVKRAINGIGTVTNLGGSLMSKEVVGAMRKASEAFVDMPELIRRTGEIVAELTGAEAGIITSGASAGLVLVTAACITGNDPEKMAKLPDATGMRNEVIVQRMLRTGWYRMLQLTGARLVEVGDADGTTPGQVEEAITEAERIHGPLAKMPFLVTDNGPSFIARRFGRHIKDLYRHVRIQYRTPTQLGLLERFHRTLKEEEIYWRLYDNPAHCREWLAAL